MWSVVSFAVWHFKYFRIPASVRPGDLALSPKCQVWGTELRLRYFCHAVIGHCAPKCQCRSKPEYFHLSQDKVRADQSSVAATLAPCHCRPPGPGWLGWSRRPQKTGTFYSFFMDLTLVRLPRCSCPPLPVTQPRPRPCHALTQVSRPQKSPGVNKSHRVIPARQ